MNTDVLIIESETRISNCRPCNSDCVRTSAALANYCKTCENCTLLKNSVYHDPVSNKRIRYSFVLCIIVRAIQSTLSQRRQSSGKGSYECSCLTRIVLSNLDIHALNCLLLTHLFHGDNPYIILDPPSSLVDFSN